LFALGVSACENEAGHKEKLVMIDSESRRSWSNYMSEHNLTTIPVCWVDNDEHNAEVANEIRETITKAYGEAGICFSGWGTCSSNDCPAIRVLLEYDGSILADDQYSYSYEVSGRSSIGISYSTCNENNIRISASGTWPTIRKRRVSIGGNAIHEFGHALGAEHEHMRTDAVGHICEKGQKDRDKSDDDDFINPQSEYYEVSNEYDPNSIMHYCSELDVLSPLDKEYFAKYFREVACTPTDIPFDEDEFSDDCHTAPLNDSNYCSSSCRCGEGEGDCDRDNECQQGLVCNQNVGADYGLRPNLDVCEREEGTDSSCHTVPLNDSDYCSSSCPCGEGEGDCDRDSHCESDLLCFHDVGAEYGHRPDLDLCLPANW
jgi:hypothetical protein